jgi:hypothetical protein
MRWLIGISLVVLALWGVGFWFFPRVTTGLMLLIIGGGFLVAHFATGRAQS